MNVQAKSTLQTAALLAARTVVLLLPLLLATPSKAYGYIDPGAGAFIYQAAYAAVLGGSFYLKKLLDRVLQRRKGGLNPSLQKEVDPARRNAGRSDILISS